MVLVGCVDVALGVGAVEVAVGAAVWTGGRPIAPGCGPDLEFSATLGAPEGTEVVVGGAAVIGAPEVVFGGGGALDPAVDEGAKYCC